MEIRDGAVKILQEGRNRKFIREVEHLTYSTKYAEEAGQKVIYVTERAVFEYRDGRLVLTEIAPGIDLERDILGQMDFVPEVSPDLREMDSRLFYEERMECK